MGNAFNKIIQSSWCAWARLRYDLTPREFSLYGLGTAPYPSWHEYMSNAHFRRLAQQVNDAKEQSTVADKLQFYEHCVRHQLPTVPILAVIDNNALPATSALRISTGNELMGRLFHYEGPFFLKRLMGHSGKGSFTLEMAGDQLKFAGRYGSASDLIDYCRSQSGKSLGYILQPRIRLEKSLETIMSSNGIGTVRAFTCLHEGRPRLLAACLKITVGENITDNFQHATSGNLAANIDTETGTLLTCRGPRMRGIPDIIDVPVHPERGRRIIGFALPEWQAAKSLVLEAATYTPGLTLLGWDVALTLGGPVLVEANARADADLIQVALGRGIRPALNAALNGAG